MGTLGEFFFGRQETVQEKADKVGFSVESSGTGYTVKGVDAYGEKATWNLDTDNAVNLLDHVHSVNLGVAYQDGHPQAEKQEIREYRLQALEDESKPGWRRLLGL